MRWVTVVAAAVVPALGVFVAAISPASIEARAQAAPFATDIGPSDDDSDALAQELEDEAAEQQTQLDEQLAQSDQQPGN
jgi:TRAP-type uncharacterized transport system fused permease subunit